MNQTRILLADKHLILVDALKTLMDAVFRIVGTAADGRALVSKAEQLYPDVILTEIDMPHLSGLDACEHLRKSLPRCKTIFLTVNEDLESAEEAFRRGAWGYIPKKAPVTELFKAIQLVLSGRAYISPLISREPISVFISRAKSREHQEPLTFRQREVLQLLAEGKSMKEAAKILDITSRTVAFHKYTMMEQLGISRSAELVRYAARALIPGKSAIPSLSY
jgi:DNA-binding NarL/FixJ family response regulator